MEQKPKFAFISIAYKPSFAQRFIADYCYQHPPIVAIYGLEGITLSLRFQCINAFEMCTVNPKLESPTSKCSQQPLQRVAVLALMTREAI